MTSIRPHRPLPGGRFYNTVSVPSTSDCRDKYAAWLCRLSLVLLPDLARIVLGYMGMDEDHIWTKDARGMGPTMYRCVVCRAREWRPNTN
jgi:hypothetical protein